MAERHNKRRKTFRHCLKSDILARLDKFSLSDALIINQIKPA